MSNGRPNEIEQIDWAHVEDLVALGFTPAKIARELGLTESSLQRLQRLNPEFGVLIDKWRDNAINNIERKLHECAEGYEHPETKAHFDPVLRVWVTHEVIKQYKPDPVAQKFILTNKAAEEWKERRQDDISVGGNIILQWMEITEEEFLE